MRPADTTPPGQARTVASAYPAVAAQLAAEQAIVPLSSTRSSPSIGPSGARMRPWMRRPLEPFLVTAHDPLLVVGGEAPESPSPPGALSAGEVPEVSCCDDPLLQAMKRSDAMSALAERLIRTI